MILMKTKRCIKCKEDKDISCFHKNGKSKDGLQYYCKPCKLKRQKAVNPEVDPDINWEKINLIKKQIKNGKYNCSGENVLGNISNDLLKILLERVGYGSQKGIVRSRQEIHSE